MHQMHLFWVSHSASISVTPVIYGGKGLPRWWLAARPRLHLGVQNDAQNCETLHRVDPLRCPVHPRAPLFLMPHQEQPQLKQERKGRTEEKTTFSLTPCALKWLIFLNRENKQTKWHISGSMSIRSHRQVSCKGLQNSQHKRKTPSCKNYTDLQKWFIC